MAFITAQTNNCIGLTGGDSIPKIVEPSVRIISKPDGKEALKLIELAGRTCYQSTDRITEDSAEAFVNARLYKDRHDALLEHYSITAAFTCDRGVQNEGVRHRLASHNVESTRYCRYSNDKYDNQITVIQPPFKATESILVWWDLIIHAEDAYMDLLEQGETPELARSVLPLCLKCEWIMTANLREWRHFFKLRCSDAAHPQIRELACELLKQFREAIPVIFDEI